MKQARTRIAPMCRTFRLPGFARLMVLAVLAGSIFAGCASERAVYPEGGRRTVVRRPIFNAPESKPFYIGGYAGSSYNPADLPAR